MSAAIVQHYLRRAIDFFDAMRLTKDDKLYRNSSALLAIHCAVSYNDALRVGLGDDKLTGDNHNQAAASLRRLLHAKHVENTDGINHLQYLVSKKSLVAYGSERLGENEFRKLVVQAERFSAWANVVGQQLNIEGWEDGPQ